MNKLGWLRASCAIGYLAPARARPNLAIQANMFVRRLIIEGRRCTGVEVERPDGSIEGVSAKLVVLSAGTLLSPWILLRSGIGPRAHLESLSVNVLRDVPGVGANLSDHPELCRKFAGLGMHPRGTAKMGPAADPLAVVDAFGCRRSVEQLVVADASIMPFVPRANTHLTCIMIGEMVGEWLRTSMGRCGL